MSKLIEFNEVGKVFASGSKKVAALADINLEIVEGDITAIIGYSGAGKSTLVRLINGLEQTTSGTVTVLGKDITNMKEKELESIRPDIGMIFQQFNLFSSRTVARNIAFPLELANWDKTKIAHRMKELLNFVGLTGYENNYPSQLSGGQKQRVGIARALATNPKILLADESTSALDPETTKEILKLLKEVNEKFGVTIVVITHEMDVVKEVADKVVVMEQGKILEQGPTYQVFSSPKTQSTKSFVSTVMPRTPDYEEIEQIRKNHPGTLLSVKLSDEYELGPVITTLNEDYQVNANIVFGGISTLNGKRLGAITFALTGKDVPGAISFIQETTEAEVISHD
ncbi:MAG: methionine ABC transporter ATP-binding protein [Micrococcaceae bacterium]